jgi:hypothetical protein
VARRAAPGNQIGQRMIISRREVLIGTAAVAAAGIVSAFPTATDASDYVRSPLTPPTAIWLRFSDGEPDGPMSSWFIWGQPSPQPRREAEALLKLHSDLAAGGTLCMDDLDALDAAKAAQLNDLAWAFSFSPSDERNWADHARAVCRWLDQEVSRIDDDPQCGIGCGG